MASVNANNHANNGLQNKQYLDAKGDGKGALPVPNNFTTALINLFVELSIPERKGNSSNGLFNKYYINNGDEAKAKTYITGILEHIILFTDTLLAPNKPTLHDYANNAAAAARLYDKLIRMLTINNGTGLDGLPLWRELGQSVKPYYGKELGFKWWDAPATTYFIYGSSGKKTPKINKNIINNVSKKLYDAAAADFQVAKFELSPIREIMENTEKGDSYPVDGQCDYSIGKRDKDNKSNCAYCNISFKPFLKPPTLGSTKAHHAIYSCEHIIEAGLMCLFTGLTPYSGRGVRGVMGGLEGGKQHKDMYSWACQSCNQNKAACQKDGSVGILLNFINGVFSVNVLAVKSLVTKNLE